MPNAAWPPPFVMMNHNLFRVAEEHLDRLDIPPPPDVNSAEWQPWSDRMLEWGKDDVIVVVLFAAAGPEAMFQDALRVSLLQPLDAKTELLGEVLEIVEDSKGSPRLKFQMIATVLGGKPISTDTQIWEDFKLLFQLRDMIIHTKPFQQGTKNKVATSLVSKHLCREISEHDTNWWMIVSTPAVAYWAMSTARRVEEHFATMLGSDGYLPLRTVFSPLEYFRSKPAGPIREHNAEPAKAASSTDEAQPAAEGDGSVPT